MNRKSTKRLDVAFIWHMHQPYYKDDLHQIYMMPWVRLHGVKDYYPMALLLEGFDNVRVTFNLVPVLIEQIDDYARNGASDFLLDLTLKRAGDLSAQDKVQILNNFFHVNYKRFIEPNRRYVDLLVKKGIDNNTTASLKKAMRNFSDQDFLDLQVLFNLSWFHSLSTGEDANLRDLVDKKEEYAEEDKEYIVKKQKEILGKIIPLYKRLQDSGKIEITTTPYYHPILPLLCDTDVARISSSGAKLPRRRFSYPEDAKWQIEEAIRYHVEHFGRRPQGMWPSEGSVSDDALCLLMDSGIKWIATDEEILFNTLGPSDKRLKGASLNRNLIYCPYRYSRGLRSLSVVFRDKNLSNLISFNYNSWDQEAAALDLLGHFRGILESQKKKTTGSLVTIVMDGENAWEYYEDNGRRFFEVLYSQLDKVNPMGTTTVSDYLKIKPARKTLRNIYPGSWINHNFTTWIGQKQKNLAWEYLQRTRRDLTRFTRKGSFKKEDKRPDAAQKAWREIYIAEGSDWNWWYGGQDGSGGDNPFDNLFRMHLRRVYRFVKEPIPDYLKATIE